MPVMPPTIKQSLDAKKRLQHQLYLARECPDPVFDISSCELNEIPSGVLSLCKVLQKEALLLHDNRITSLKGAGNFADLANLRVLDLHSNRLTILSDVDLTSLQRLQVLNLENNKLRSLPPYITSLRALQTLNVRGNEISQLPADINQLNCLRSLDITKNKITVLPKQLCGIQTLETLSVDSSQMRYPPASVCAEGTEAIMVYLCSESGVRYVHPSEVMLKVLSTPQPVAVVGSSFGRGRSQSATESAIANTVMQYENLKDQRRRELLMLEKMLEEDQRQQAMLAARAAAEKNHLLKFVAEEQSRVHQELLAAQQVKESERSRLLETLAEAERNASNLVSSLLEMNERARKTEALLDQMEKERIHLEQWYTVRQEELDMVRRRDVLASMEKILQDNEALEGLINKYLSNQEDITRRKLDRFSEDDSNMENVLNSKDAQRQLLIQQIMKEEELQKEAFEVLQCQRDARHKRITSQIQLIEQELAELTLLEVEQRQMRLDTQVNVLAERRLALAELLLQLLDERDQREKELRARLAEMEKQRLANQTGYWLAQYQRLLDSKPQSLIDQENHIELDVIAILTNAGASDYIPNFACHHISIETLLQMSDDDLSKIGVHELGLRRAIQREIEHFLEQKKLTSSPKGKPTTLLRQSSSRPRLASAPPQAEGLAVAAAAAAPVGVMARGLHSECVICQDGESVVLFLNCGHVCTCAKCSTLVHECPLDRSEIVQRIRLPSSLDSPTAADDDDDAIA